MTAATAARLRTHPLLQIAMLALFWLAGEAMVRMTGLAVPGGVVGLALAFALLACGVVRPSSLQHGANWLLGQMLLFFVPAVPAVMDHRELLGVTGAKILVVILAGTAAVMASTALTVELFHRLASRREGGDVHDA
jgi:holin-like protein